MEMGERGRGRRPWRGRVVRHRAVAVLLTGAAGLAVLAAVLVVLPGVVVNHDLGGASVAAQDRLKAVNDVRTTLLQAVGGMVVLFGASAGLYHANLTQASLVSVNLRHADLKTAILRRARCVLADLRGARLVEADLRDADFTEADLREANLRKADAGGAVFHRADLRLSDLRGCDLGTADLREARLTGALASDRTRWPGGFDHAAAGVVVTEDPGPEPPPLLQPPGMTTQHQPLRSLQ